VADKIVVYNQGWLAASTLIASYSQTVYYRVLGASEAAKKGAVGALVQSVTDFSIASPHTGQQVCTVDGYGQRMNALDWKLILVAG